VVAWWPFVRAEGGLGRLVHATSWIPLAAYMGGERSMGVFRDVVLEIGVYVPLGALLQILLARLRLPAWCPRRLIVALAMVAVVATVLELGQAFFVGHVADTTDIVSHVVGGLVGYLTLALLVRPGPAPGGQP
jgi:glycopeptide antibiotics resistance protein